MRYAMGYGGQVMGEALRLPHPPRYLAFFDPESRGGFGTIVWSPDPKLAIGFLSFEDLMKTWKTVPRNHPVRKMDGKPNRPLTAFSIMPVEYPE